MEFSSQAEAAAKIAQLVKEAAEKISEAEEIADKYGVKFNLDIGGSGMGGTYSPQHKDDSIWNKPEQDDDWESSSEDDGGWNASSNSC